MHPMRLVEAVKILLALAVVGMLSGCVGPTISSDGEGFNVTNGPHNVSVWNGEQWHTSLQGMSPHNAVIDKDGVNVQSSGLNTVLGVVMGDPPQFFTSNPADTTFDTLMYHPDGTLEIQNFASIKSTPTESWLPALLRSLEVQGLLAEQQAETWKVLIESGQATVADLIASVFTGGV